MSRDRLAGLSPEMLSWLLRRALGGGVVFIVVGAIATLVGIDSLQSGDGIGVLGVLSGAGFVAFGLWFLLKAIQVRRRQRSFADSVESNGVE